MFITLKFFTQNLRLKHFELTFSLSSSSLKGKKQKSCHAVVRQKRIIKTYGTKNAGVLSAEEATNRREEIAQEADFYGSMDGASKFVKGDAIASILILAINIIGGLIIGISQYDLPVSTAAETYVLLSIGDGLVAQIPSLLLAISTAIIVTRVSSKQDMATHIGDQLSISRAWIPVSAVLLLIGFVPGMPNLLFITSAIVAATAGFLARRVERKRETKIEDSIED